MAITAPTTTSDFSGFLTPEMSEPIFEDAARQSVVMSLVPRVPLGINGQKIPIVTSKPTASWTAEAAAKHKTKGELGLLEIAPHKLTAIAVMSAEVVRANPGNYTGLLRSHLAEAFATAFDYAALYGLGGDGTGSGPFDHHVAETTKSVTLGTTAQADGGLHGDIVAGLKLLVDDGKRLRGFAFDDRAEPLFLGAVDANGRPIYVDTPLEDTAAAARPGRLIGRPSFMSEGVAHEDAEVGTYLGFGGDWRKAAWGAVGGISFRVSTEATVTINGQLTSLWEHNLVAVLAEAEYGFVMADTEAFVAYLTDVPGGDE